MTNTTPNPAPKNSKRDRWLKFGIVGALLALVVSVTPLLSSTNSEALTDGGHFCIQATSEQGKFISTSGVRGCAAPDAESTPTSTQTVEPCKTPADLLAAQVADLQAKADKLKAAQSAFLADIDTATKAAAVGAGYKAGNSTFSSFNFTVDPGALNDALCDGGDPVSVLKYQISSSTKISSGPIPVGTLQVTFDGTASNGSIVRVTVTQPVSALNPATLQPVGRVVQDRVVAGLKS
jgi:hypothetical protein